MSSPEVELKMQPQQQQPRSKNGARVVKQMSKYEKLDRTKFLKHYRPDPSFFQKKGNVYMY